jgi:hypothetical protein
MVDRATEAADRNHLPAVEILIGFVAAPPQS